MILLDGKVAIVTGACSGIGRTIAQMFAAHGAAVVLAAQSETKLNQVADSIRSNGGRAHIVVGDISQIDTHEQLVEVAMREFGGLDIAINHADTVESIKPLADTVLDDWRQTLTINLTTAYLGACSQIPVMLLHGGGSIIFISSFFGASVDQPGLTAHGASKAGLMGLVKGITADYAAQGIRADALVPGGMDTEMMCDQSQKERSAGLHTMKRIAQPDEIAFAVLSLVSPMASFVTGSALLADGGNAAVK